jgi:hypothetical protein
MTLAVTVVCQDGVVVAADSRTTLSNYRSSRVGSDYTHKVFGSGKVAAATWGEAFILGRSMAGHMADFAEAEVAHCDHPEDAAERLAEYFGDLYDQVLPNDLDLAVSDRATLGFLVAGYDERGVAEAWEVSVAYRSIGLVATSEDGGGAVWRGQSDVVSRLLFGYDQDLLRRIAQDHHRERELRAIEPLLDQLAYRIPFDTMNLQDGIDLAVLCLRTTMAVQRFSLGALAEAPAFSWPGVGGPIEIATVTERGGFAWVQRTAIAGAPPSGGP